MDNTPATDTSQYIWSLTKKEQKDDQSLIQLGKVLQNAFFLIIRICST